MDNTNKLKWSNRIGIRLFHLPGSLYFTENNTNKIGRLVLSTNSFTEWTVPTKSNYHGFQSIAFDSNSHDIYFVEHNGNKIGRLAPDSNLFTEWTVPTKSNNVSALLLTFQATYTL